MVATSRAICLSIAVCGVICIAPEVSSHEALPDYGGSRTVRAISLYNGALEDCAVAQPNVTRVIRITLDPGNPARDVYYKDPIKIKGKREVDNDYPMGGSQMDPYSDQPYDVDIAGFGNNGDYTEVRVILTNRAYEFNTTLTDEVPKNKKIYGIGKGDPGNDLRLCGNILDPDDPSGRVAIFYIPTGNTSKKASLINIIINPLGAANTRIYIDPKVHDGT